MTNAAIFQRDRKLTPGHIKPTNVHWLNIHILKFLVRSLDEDIIGTDKLEHYKYPGVDSVPQEIIQ